MALIGYTITVVAKQDNPYNVLPETDISIRKNSDNTLVNIYADEAGLIPIPQLGAKTDSNGQFTFYADASLGILKAVWTNGGVIATEVLDQGDHSRLVNRNAVGAHDAIYSRNFKTVSDLKAGIDADGNGIDMSQIVGSKVFWRGYYAESDGGGNWGIVKSGSHTEDGFKIFSVNPSIYIDANIDSNGLDAKKGGVIGDGTTADYLRIQNLIDLCSERVGGVDRVPLSKTIIIPFQDGGYTFNTPLNLTSDNGQANRRGIEIKGSSRPAGGDWPYGTLLIFATNGKAMIEIVDSDGFTLTDLKLQDTGDSTGASVGIYQARRTSGVGAAQWTGNAQFKNSVIRFLNDDRALNNNFGAIGIINIAGEETTYNEMEVWANMPLVISSSNTFRKLKDNAPAAEGAAYDDFEYSPVHANVSEITEGFSNTVFRTNNCRFVAKGRNAPTVLLYEVGSYFPKGDFLQKRDAFGSGGNGVNSTAYECWNINQMTGDSICESHRTLMMFHRQANQVDMNLRGADDGFGNSAIGLIHFAADATGFSLENSKINIDYAGLIPNQYITYTSPVGVGELEPSVYGLRNVNLKLNKDYNKNFIDSKIPYVCKNVAFDFSNFNMLVNERKITFPIPSKSIGAPATVTDFLRVEIPGIATGLNGCSFTVEADLHVSNAEIESAGLPSSLGITAKWQFVRDQNATSSSTGVGTFGAVTASTSQSANDITGLTLSALVSNHTDVFLRMASIQTGANGASASVSGSATLTYAGCYSRVPTISIV